MPTYNRNPSQPSYYYQLSQQFYPNGFQSSTQYGSVKQLPQVNQMNQHSALRKDFYNNRNLYSAYRSVSYKPKDRSASLPGQRLISNLNSRHFSYIDQLKRRDYILGGNYKSSKGYVKDNVICQQRPYDRIKCPNPALLTTSYDNRLRFNTVGSSSSLYNLDLNRFSKYEQDKKISKRYFDANKGPLIKTNIKIYNSPDTNNRISSVHSNFQPNARNVNQIPNDLLKKQKQHLRTQQPLMDCNLQVRSQGDGRFCSTLSTYFPNIITDQKTQYDAEKNIIFTEATLVRNFPNLLHKQIEAIQLKKAQNQTKKLTKFEQQVINDFLKEQNKKIAQRYNTYILQKKNTCSRSKPKTNAKIKSIKKTTHQNNTAKIESLEISEQALKSKYPISKRIVMEYQIQQPKKKKKSPHKNHKCKQNKEKSHQKTQSLCCHRKHCLQQRQRQKSNTNKSKSSSIRNNQKSKKQSKSKRSISNHSIQKKTIKKAEQVSSPRSKQNLLTKNKLNQKNYVSTHLLTTKK